MNEYFYFVGPEDENLYPNSQPPDPSSLGWTANMEYSEISGLIYDDSVNSLECYPGRNGGSTELIITQKGRTVKAYLSEKDEAQLIRILTAIQERRAEVRRKTADWIEVQK